MNQFGDITRLVFLCIDDYKYDSKCIVCIHRKINDDDNYNNPPPIQLPALKPSEIKEKKALLTYPVAKFELFINLKAQPDNKYDDWFPLLSRLAKAPITNSAAPKIKQNMDAICTNITHGFISNAQQSFSITNIPTALEKMIAKYSFEDAYFFEEWPDESDYYVQKRLPWKPSIHLSWKIN